MNPAQPVLDDHRSSQEWAVFVEDEFTIKKGLILNAGLRHDQYQQFGGTTNPCLARIYSTRKRTTLKLIYSQAFRAPNNYELYFGDQISIEPNPFLRPEKIRTEELCESKTWALIFASLPRVLAVNHQEIDLPPI